METRLNLLCDAGVIDKDICKGMIEAAHEKRESVSR